jgi:hypothetical protein
MAEITIDSNKVFKAALMVIGVIALIAIVGGGAYLLGSHAISGTLLQPSTPAYPSVLTFTVLSTTTSTGHYQVLTTAGNILYMPDYTTWNMMYPQSTYTATITGSDGVAYYVSSVTRAGYSPYSYGYNQQNYRYNYRSDNQHSVTVHSGGSHSSH